MTKTELLEKHNIVAFQRITTPQKNIVETELNRLWDSGKISKNILREVFEELSLMQVEPIPTLYLVWEIERLKNRHKPLRNLMDRNNFFTTEKNFENVEVIEYSEGIYYQFRATQAICNVFVDWCGNIIRKPINAKEKKVLLDATPNDLECLKKKEIRR